MAKPSGVKITFAIDELAKWWNRELGAKYHSIDYSTMGPRHSRWYLCLDHEILDFPSFSVMRRWMEGEVKRRKVLFKQF